MRQDTQPSPVTTKHRFDPCSDWPKDTPRPKPWPAVLDLQRAQTDDEASVLKASVDRYGVKSPLILMRDGRILDGHKRGDLARKLGLQLPEPVVMPEGTTDEEGLLLARQIQVGSRNLTSDDWKRGKAAIEALYMALREAGSTQQEAAKTAGVPRSTGRGLERRRLIRKKAPLPGKTTNGGSANGGKPIPDKRRKLTPKDEAEIVKAVARGESQAEVAERYGISQQAVSKLAQAVKETKPPRTRPPRRKRRQPMVQGLPDLLSKANQVDRALQRQGETPLPVQAQPVLDGLAETLSGVRYEDEEG
jgi:DNA-binding XRE family transcriptional regulator